MGPTDKNNKDPKLANVSTAETENQDDSRENGGGKAPKQSTAPTRGTTIPYQRGPRSILSMRTSQINNNNTAGSSGTTPFMYDRETIQAYELSRASSYRSTPLNSRPGLGLLSHRLNQRVYDVDERSSDDDDVVVIDEREELPLRSGSGGSSVAVVDLTIESDDSVTEIEPTRMRLGLDQEPTVDLTTESDDEDVMEVEPTRMQLEVEEDQEAVAGPSSSPPLTGIYMVD